MKLKKTFKISELSSLFMKNTLSWLSDTPPLSRTSGKIYFGPFKFKINMLQKDVKSKNNTTACGTQSETKPTTILLKVLTPRDSSSLVFHLEVDLLQSVMSISIIWVSSTKSKSSLSVPQELLMLTGLNGWKLKLNLIQSTSVLKVTQFVSFQDVSHQSVTTDIQELDTHATKRLKSAVPLEKLTSNGKICNWTLWSRMLSNHLLRNKTKTKLEELLITLLDTRTLKTTLG